MRRFKKIIGILSSVAMLFSVVPLTVFAENLPEPAHSKTVTSNDDGTYTLNLDVTGKVEQSKEGTPSDILLIVDTSGSMAESISSGSRMQKVQSLINNLADNVLLSGTDNQMAMVSFSGDDDDGWYDRWDDSQSRTAWTKNAIEIKTASNSLPTNGGTNWQAGFREGKAKLAELEGRENSQKYVIFISDGDPTYHYNQWGWTTGGGSYTSDDDVSAATNEAKGITGTTFYSVGIGESSQRMSNLATAMNGIYKNAETEGALNQIFSEIESMIVKNYKGVTISDTLSEYAEMVDPTQLVVTAKHADQTDAVIPDGASASYDANTKTVRLSFPAEFALEDSVTYTVSFAVRPSQAAKDKYISDGHKYPHTGDAETGSTSAGQAGFFSNATAQVTYNGGTSEYAKPVIQVAITPIKELPKAGGTGTTWLFIFGISMVLFAGSLLIIQKKNFEKVRWTSQRDKKEILYDEK